MKNKIDNAKRSRLAMPVFFIGVPRSGTTIVFEAFARHEEIGWLSNYTEKFPGLPFFNLLVPLCDNKLFYLSSEKKQHNKVLLGNKILPKPAEAYSFWNRKTGIDFAKKYLTGEFADEIHRNKVCSSINRIIGYQRKHRFSTKITGPARIGYLRSIFPDAYFIHVIRDGRAVVNSLLNVKFWKQGKGDEEVWWDGGINEQELIEWRKKGADPAVLAAIQWKKIITLAREESSLIPESHYREIRYEEFIINPVKLIHSLYSWAGLKASSRFEKYISKKGKYEDMNKKYQQKFSPDVVSAITESMSPLLKDLNYT